MSQACSHKRALLCFTLTLGSGEVLFSPFLEENDIQRGAYFASGHTLETYKQMRCCRHFVFKNKSTLFSASLEIKTWASEKAVPVDALGLRKYDVALPSCKTPLN